MHRRSRVSHSASTCRFCSLPLIIRMSGTVSWNFGCTLASLTPWHSRAGLTQKTPMK